MPSRARAARPPSELRCSEVVGQAVDATERFARTMATCACIAIDYKWNLRGMDEASPEYETALLDAHVRTAHRMFRLCKAHGGIYTKFGQYVSSMNHVLPEQVTSILAGLQDKARFRPYEVRRRTLIRHPPLAA